MAPRKKTEEPVEKTSICKNCRWAEFKGGVIHCHRYPPVPIYDAQESTTEMVLPIAQADGYCGEFTGKLNS